jgi:hypothetical protein
MVLFAAFCSFSLMHANMFVPYWWPAKLLWRATWIAQWRRPDAAHDTLEASNFGPHRNFGLFLAFSAVLSLDESCTKKEQNRISRSRVFVKHLFSSFFCRTRFYDSKFFWKSGPKYSWGPKLGALTVTHGSWLTSFNVRIVHVTSYTCDFLCRESVNVRCLLAIFKKVI